MVENLLWPKKLTEPPQLLVDIQAMFNGKSGNFTIPAIGSLSTSDNIKYRLIDVSSDGSNTFRMGFIRKLSMSRGADIMRTAMPFQNITAGIDEYRCHGWQASNVDLLSTPDRTEVAKSVLYPANINVPAYYTYINGHKSLFKMVSDEFADTQFSSVGHHTGVNCTIDYNIIDVQNDFLDMYNSYNTGTLAIEVIVKVKVYSGYSSNGFQVGIV